MRPKNEYLRYTVRAKFLAALMNRIHALKGIRLKRYGTLVFVDAHGADLDDAQLLQGACCP